METGRTVRPRVVIIGAGFGGLACARRLRNEPVDVVLVDRRNYHLFTPLLYQVASCLLAPGEIAAPLRKVFRGAGNVRFRMGDVARIDYDARIVHLADGDAAPVPLRRARRGQSHELLRERRSRGARVRPEGSR